MSTTTSVPALKNVAPRWGPWLLTGLFLVAAVIIFAMIYEFLPAQGHFYALLGIGVLSLFLSIGSYLAEAFSREPTAQRSLAWGFFGMGFATLFLTFGLGPQYGAISATVQLFGLLFTILALIVGVAFIGWRIRTVRSTKNREVAREAWRQEPAPSAFSYAAANSPSVPSVAPPPSAPPPPRSP